MSCACRRLCCLGDTRRLPLWTSAATAHWALANNLTLNIAKSQEILFSDKRRKEKFSAPAKIAELKRVQTIKILGVTVTNGLSVSPHVHSVIASCVQTLYALRVLRAHGLCDSALQTVYRAVVVAKLTIRI